MKFFLVGGTPRNHHLGLDSGDMDFAVEAPSFDAMKAELLKRGLDVWQERPEFVTLRGRFPLATFGNFSGLVNPFGAGPQRDTAAGDFTLCRAEAQYSDRRHPDKVTPADLETDLARRDFTMNAMAVSEDGEWHDPFGGLEDLDNGLIRTVGDAGLRFVEDPLRILRALRFKVTLKLLLHTDVQDALDRWSMVSLLRTLPKERVMEELNKMLSADWGHTSRLLFNDHPMVGSVVSDMGLRLRART
jgi:tRNA nucleotidyltransferase/poly(A) polymerase